MGWDLSRNLSSTGALRALRKALRALPAGSSLIHHSDRGSQYCSAAYVKELEKHNVLISMTESRWPFGRMLLLKELTAFSRQSGSIKRRLKSWDDALTFVEKIVDLYNNERPHQSISFLTPDLVHRSGITTERKWKNYYRQNVNSDGITPNLTFEPERQAVAGQSTESVNLCQ